MTNQEISCAFEKLAFFLSLKNESGFKINAYRKVARCIQKFPLSVEELLLAGLDLTQIPGIGKIIAKKIEDLIIIGEIKPLAELLREFPESLFEISQISGVGPKTILKMFQVHHIRSMADLGDYLRQGNRLAIASSYERKIRKYFLP
jgi:DNA polymerase (family X)